MKTLLQPIFQRHWNPYVVLLIAGLLSALYFGLTSTVWAVTGEFTRLGGDVLLLLGVNASEWQYYGMVGLQGSTWSRADGWIVWGMFIGALTMVLLSNSFKIRLPQQKRRYVQGFIGGIVMTALLATVFAPFLTVLSWKQGLVAGLLIGLAGFIGDAVFSSIKRDLDIKDTGSLIPGHGGLLDRMDSLMYSTPIFFHYFYYITKDFIG